MNWKVLLSTMLVLGLMVSTGCDDWDDITGRSKDEDHSTGAFTTLAKISSVQDPRPDEHDVIVIWKMDNGKNLALTSKTVYWIDAPSCSSRFIGEIWEFSRGDIVEYMWDTEDMIVNIHGARVYPTDVVKSCENYKSEPEPAPTPPPHPCCP